MKAPVAVSAICLVLVACGGGSDDPAEFVACLTERGGGEVSAASELARLDWKHAEDGGGASLEHLRYSLIDVPADKQGDRALVVLDSGLQGNALASAVREDPGKFRAVVLMPPRATAETHRPVEDCVDEAAPGEMFP